MIDPGPNEYLCECCGGIFKKGWSDEEAQSEAKENFGDLPPEEAGVVCDDCYKKLMEWAAIEHPELWKK